MSNFKKQTSGFVLLPVLIFMQIFSALGLYHLTAAMLLMKTNTHELERLRIIYFLQHRIKNLENNLSLFSACMIAPTEPAEISKWSLDWWQSVGCSGNSRGIRYYYVAELLGQNFCASINKYDDSHKITVGFYRITLVASSPSLMASKIILQTTFSKMSHELVKCKAQPEFIVLGQQMQRFI